MLHIGDNLRALRRNRLLSQKKLADELHISEDAISSYEREISQPPLEQVLAICKFFNISVESFVYDEIMNLSPDGKAVQKSSNSK